MTSENFPVLPDGSSFFTASMPLPEGHWLYADQREAPPMPFRIGENNPRRVDLKRKVRAAARYAIRAATDNGKLKSFDPDAMEQAFIVGLLGYNTEDGTGSEDWNNPDPIPPLFFKEASDG